MKDDIKLNELKKEELIEKRNKLQEKLRNELQVPAK